MLIARDLTATLRERATQYPIVTVTGPRQSGKSTLVRSTFPTKPYVSLESLDTRDEASRDTRKFLAQFPSGAILDEVQRVPAILSYLQEIVDESRRDGEWILTGSQHFTLHSKVTQSLAGRTAILYLLPLSVSELRARLPSDPYDLVFRGGYPRIHERGIDPGLWLEDYIATYVERDVREVLEVQNLTAFQTFLRLCAGRAGQIVNLSSLGADAGVTHPTSRKWISVLETSFLCHRLPPYFRSQGKRLVKSTKLYFFDTGLLCRLLRIESADALRVHPLRGSIFECWVIAELIKAYFHRGKRPDWHFYRDHDGREIDAVLDRPSAPLAVEVKSSEGASSLSMSSFQAFSAQLGDAGKSLKKYVAHAGSDSHVESGITWVPWNRVDEIAN